MTLSFSFFLDDEEKPSVPSTSAGVRIGNLKCNFCAKLFLYNFSLVKHVNRKHQNPVAAKTEIILLSDESTPNQNIGPDQNGQPERFEREVGAADRVEGTDIDASERDEGEERVEGGDVEDGDREDRQNAERIDDEGDVENEVGSDKNDVEESDREDPQNDDEDDVENEEVDVRQAETLPPQNADKSDDEDDDVNEEVDDRQAEAIPPQNAERSDDDDRDESQDEEPQNADELPGPAAKRRRHDVEPTVVDNENVAASTSASAAKRRRLDVDNENVAASKSTMKSCRIHLKKIPDEDLDLNEVVENVEANPKAPEGSKRSCPYCSFSSNSQNSRSLRWHCAAVHFENYLVNYFELKKNVCAICNKRFRSKKKFLNHFGTDHQDVLPKNLQVDGGKKVASLLCRNSEIV